jgi:flagellar export protein FliJ
VKAFKFSLQPLRTLRERQEQTVLHEYASTVAARQRALDQLADAEQAREQAWATLTKQGAEGATARELAQLQAYGAAQERACQRRGQELRSAAELMRVAFDRLVAARKATAVVDRYFELQRRAFLRRRRLHEQQLLDELSQRSSLRRFSDEPATTTLLEST